MPEKKRRYTIDEPETQRDALWGLLACGVVVLLALIALLALASYNLPLTR